MPRKLGQHFLKDQKALRKITAALEISSCDTIVEIGPGHGELTRHLLDVDPKKVIAIERDKKLATSLKKNLQLSPLASYSGSKEIEIIEGDILKILPVLYSKFKIRNSKLVGNIPYYITGYLLRKVGELEKKPKLIVFTIQKEVAERICAVPPEMNLLAASVQFWGEPKIIGYISKKSFRPQPKVDSAIIKIIPSPETSDRWSRGMKAGRVVKAEEYYKFIKILFKQPRKMVLNNLRGGFKLPQKEVEERLKMLRISPKSRPANLSMTDINNLSANFPQ